MSIREPARPASFPRGGRLNVGLRISEQVALLLAICLLPVLLYLPFLAEPFDRDEGVYATIAQGLLHGQAPYRDLFDHKPPLIYGWYALSFAGFGENVAAPRIMASLTLSLTTFGVYRVAHMLLSEREGYAAAAIFGLSLSLVSLQMNANTEVFMLLPLVGSLVAFVHGLQKERWHWFLLSGLALGLATMTKPVAIWNLAALLPLLVWVGRGRGLLWPALAGKAAAVLAGCLLMMALVALPFVLIGSGDDFLFANLRYNWLYSVQVPAPDKLSNFMSALGFFLVVAGPLALAALTGFVLLLRSRSWVVAVILAAWFAGSLAGVVSTGRFFTHYWVQLLPALALLAAGAFEFQSARVLAQRLRLGLAWLMGLGLLLTLAANFHAYAASSPEGKHLAKYPDPQAQWDNSSRGLAQYLRTRTSPDQTIYVYGRETQVYFYADRKPAARFIYSEPFSLDPATLGETIRSLYAAKPAYIVDSLQPPIYPDWQRDHPPELIRLLADEYEYAGQVEYAQVYRLKIDLHDDLYRQQFQGDYTGRASLPVR